MTTQLDSLRSMTVVVADTGDIDAIKKYQPQDATTNPSLILSASALPQYAPIIDEAITYAKAQSADKAKQLIDAEDKLAVNIGLEILKLVPGRVSTEVDARLSYDTQRKRCLCGVCSPMFQIDFPYFEMLFKMIHFPSVLLL